MKQQPCYSPLFTKWMRSQYYKITIELAGYVQIRQASDLREHCEQIMEKGSRGVCESDRPTERRHAAQSLSPSLTYIVNVIKITHHHQQNLFQPLLSAPPINNEMQACKQRFELLQSSHSDGAQ